MSYVESMEYKARVFTFGIAPKVTKGLGPKPPKAEKPGDIPKIRKLATLKQYGFFYGIPPGFSPAERFFRQRPKVTGVTRVAGVPPYGGTISLGQRGGGIILGVELTRQNHRLFAHAGCKQRGGTGGRYA